MIEPDIVIRPEQPEDASAVREVNAAAFERPAEANLVTALHAADAAVVALVAEAINPFETALAKQREIVGHILFSPVALDPAVDRRVLGLAPMAVAPPFQNRGIGSQLVRAGLDHCRADDAHAVVVLGHTHYYPRFGFRPALELGLRCEYDVPPEVFMALELVPGALGAEGSRRGPALVRYHAAFSDV